MTALDLITQAMRTIGVLAASETPNDGEARDALVHLQSMIDAWAVHRLSILTVARSAYSLASGTAEYTIGAGATFSQARPVWLEGAALLVDGFERPLEILTDQRYRLVPDKTTPGEPCAVYYNPTYGASGYGTLTFYPVPDAVYTVVLYTPTAITQPTVLTTTLALAPGYHEALRYQLAVRLCPEFGRPLDPVVADLARESFAAIKRANTRPVELAIDPALRGRSTVFHIETGE